jgi:hypothetical protein
MANNYTLGRGRVYFDRFDAAGVPTGFRYLGNTPAVGVTRSSQTLDHYDSDRGLKVKDKSVTLQEDLGLTFETDNISVENLALWFGGAAGAGGTVPALTDATSTLAAPVTPGVAYYVGADNIAGVTVAKSGGGAVTDFTIDAAGGFITFGGAGIVNTDSLVVTYDAAAVTSTARITDSGATIYGALRYVSDNPVGANQNQNYPYCKLTANGNLDLKGDQWQKLAFTVEVLKRDSATGRYTIDMLPGSNL